MKKAKLFIALFAILSFITCSAQQRLSLVELFSGASCSPCAIHVPALEDTISLCQDKVIILRHQLNIPAYDPMYNEYPSGPNARYSYYSLDGVPALRFDGDTTDFDMTRSVIDARNAIPSPFNINLTYTKTDTKIDVSMIINAVSNISGNLKARIAVIENEIAYPTPPGSNGERFFFKVLKQFIPSPTGTTLAGSWTIGEDDTITGSWTFANVHDKNEIAVIAYIQDDNTKEILQAAFAKPQALDDLDAAVTTINDIPAKMCQGNVAGLSPRITLVNKGNTPLTKVDLEYQVNDLPASSYTWNGNLDQTEFAIVHLPLINPSPLLLNDRVLVTIKGVNELVNDNNSDNDTLGQAYGASMTLEEHFKIKFKSGSLGANFGWRIVNENTDIHGSHWDYNVNVNDSVVTLTDVDPDCWLFILKNINNVLNPQNFYFRIFNMADSLIYETKTMGHTLEIPFHNVLPVGIEGSKIHHAECMMYPNPASDEVMIKMNEIPENASVVFYNVLGANVLEREIRNSSVISVSCLEEGVYFYHVMIDGKMVHGGKFAKMKR